MQCCDRNYCGELDFNNMNAMHCVKSSFLLLKLPYPIFIVLTKILAIFLRSGISDTPLHLCERDF